MPRPEDFLNNFGQQKPQGLLGRFPQPAPSPTPARAPSFAGNDITAPRTPIFSTGTPKNIPTGVANPAQPEQSFWAGDQGQAALRSILSAGNIMQQAADPQGRHAATRAFAGIEGGLNTFDTIRRSQTLRKREEKKRAAFAAAGQETTPLGRAEATTNIGFEIADLPTIKVGLAAEKSFAPEAAVESKSSLANLDFKHDKELIDLKETHKTTRDLAGTVLDQAAADQKFTRDKELLDLKQGKEDARLKLKMDASKKQFDSEFSLKQKESLAKIDNKTGKELTAEEKILQHQKITSGAYKQAVAEADKEFPDIVPRMVTFSGVPIPNPMFDEAKHGEQYDDYLAFIETKAAEGRGETLQAPGKIGGPERYIDGAPQFNQAYINGMQDANDGITMKEIIGDYNERFSK